MKSSNISNEVQKTKSSFMTLNGEKKIEKKKFYI